jgi:hypothetical protein
MKRILFLMVLISLFYSCSTVSKKDCANKDWFGEGYHTGLTAGNPAATLEAYRATCGKEHGINPDPARFMEGVKAGTTVLCTPEGAFEFGKNGGVYNNSCPKETEEKFYAAYQRGQTIYTSQKLRAMDARIQDLEDDNRRKQYEIDRLQTELMNERSRQR